MNRASNKSVKNLAGRRWPCPFLGPNAAAGRRVPDSVSLEIDNRSLWFLSGLHVRCAVYLQLAAGLSPKVAEF